MLTALLDLGHRRAAGARTAVRRRYLRRMLRQSASRSACWCRRQRAVCIAFFSFLVKLTAVSRCSTAEQCAYITMRYDHIYMYPLLYGCSNPVIKNNSINDAAVAIHVSIGRCLISLISVQKHRLDEVAVFLLTEQAVGGRPPRYATMPRPRARRSAFCRRTDGNVAAVSHGQHVLTPTAAAA